MNNGKICVSVCAEKAAEFLEKVERATKIADVVELRFDCLEEREFDSAIEKVSKLKNTKLFLATFRPKSDDALFACPLVNTASDVLKERKRQAVKYRENGWIKIAQLKNVDFIDFEGDIVNEFFIDFSSTPVVFSKEADEKLKKRKIIVSEHNFDGVPKNLDSLYEGMWIDESEGLKIEVIKIAAQAKDVTDSLALMKLLERAKSDNRELIPIAMGESGVWTRILGLSRGAFMTFAALDEESATAPGQLTAREMLDVYRVKELDETSEIYGLVAESVAYSVSPQMHNAAFKFHKMNAVYVPFAVKNLEEFIRRMVNPKTREIDWDFRGFSITIPHKIEIMKYLDFVDETARKIGAVNTVKIEGDKLLGFNTDADGFIEPLKNAYGDLNGARVAVFGAGGAARACVYALQRENANVTVFARNSEKAKSLVVDFGVEIQDLQSQIENLKNFDAIVNATPLGMKKGGLENETPVTAEQLKGVGLVYDLVYNPFETRLMREASSVFAPTIGGLAMLVAQAAAQQKIWTGKEAPVKEMSAAALGKLQS
ncbi:MAG TPA: shikimate dehydrogenase [Pyrinomonadaceae bacterium]|jgi:3-dehydroquinate dehydratase/shikimate dehydrogenase